MTEPEFLGNLSRMVANKQITFAQADNQLTARYESLGTEGRKELREALDMHRRNAERLAQNLGVFSSIDARTQNQN